MPIVPAPPGVPGRFALPGGLVDAHVHVSLDFDEINLSREELVERHTAALRRAGILAARDLGGPPSAPRISGHDPAWLHSADRLLAPPGTGYPHLCEHVPDEGAVARALELVAAGAQWVKVMWDFPGADGNWLAAPTLYREQTVSELVAAVHDAGARVAVHSTGPNPGGAVALGVDSIEHGVGLTRAHLEAMAASGCFWVPTLWAAHRHMDPVRDLGPGPAAMIDGVFAHYEENIATARDLGVPVLAGSDETLQGDLWREVELLARHGLSPDEAIASASNAARTALRIPAPDGWLVTFDGDPREDIGALARPAAVIAPDA